MKNCSKYCCLVIAFTFTFFLSNLCAQGNNPVVSFHYNNTPLKSILNDISKKYQLSFSYSSDNIQAQRPINFHVEKQPLNKALNQLFTSNNILHTTIGEQIVLKADKDAVKPKQMSQDSNFFNTETDTEFETNVDLPEDKTLADRENQLIEADKIQQKKLAEEKISLEKKQEFLSDVVDGITMENRTKLSTKEIEPIKASPIPTNFVNTSPTKAQEIQQLPKTDSNPPTKDYTEEYRLAQVSVFPTLGTNTDNPDLINLFSFNVFWGVNGGLAGAELGLFGNSIKRNMNGIQMAGLFNTVGNETNGIQMAGLFNLGAGDLHGIQTAGLWNTAKNTFGIQTAGLFNLSSGELWGIQAAGFGNIVSGRSYGGQYAGVMNVAKDISGVQVAGVLNTARHVEGVQVSGLINRARTVRGIQVGLINIVDSIHGVPFGLINIVRKNGYNKLELSAAETMYANLSFKFGAKALYSILEVSGHRNLRTWSAGYGLGVFCPMGRVAGINFEVVSAQVNENIYWEQELNLLNQVRMTFDFRITRHFSLFFGPAFNVMTSRVYHTNTGEIGSNIPLYHFYDETFNGTNIKMWIGAKAGIRLL